MPAPARREAPPILSARPGQRRLRGHHAGPGPARRLQSIPDGHDRPSGAICPDDLNQAGLLLTALLILASSSAGCQPARPPLAQAPPPEVSVATPVARQVYDYSYYTGRTEAIESVDVRARVSGYLDKSFNKSAIAPDPAPGEPPPADGAAKPQARRILEGEEVQKGEILFRIDKRPYQAEYDRLRASIERDEALVKRTEAEYRRSVDLFRRNVLSREDFDKSEASYKEARATVEADKASLDRARLDLEFCDVTAPISGRVGRAMVTEGNLITASVANSPTLTTIVTQDPIFVYFRPDERSLLRFVRRRAQDRSLSAATIRDAQIPVDLSLADEGDAYPYHGTIDFSDNQVDPSTGTINVRGRFDNKGKQLTPGLFARVRIGSPEPHDALLIPERAIQSDQNKKYVWVVDKDGTVGRKDITLGDQPGALREVTEGLEAGDRIIVRGMQRARDGLKVDAKPAAFDDMGNVITGETKTPSPDAPKRD
ncbi:MAG: efflux RND transporter periplasmic adaptor subunit [Isosphaeraceae bacterium]